MLKIANAFSLNMLQEFPCDIHFQEISKNEVQDLFRQNNQEIDSYVGHEDTARVLSTELGVTIPAQRRSLVLSRDETLLIAQLIGSRLPEGATQLPANFRFKYFLAKIL